VHVISRSAKSDYYMSFSHFNVDISALIVPINDFISIKPDFKSSGLISAPLYSPSIIYYDEGHFLQNKKRNFELEVMSKFLSELSNVSGSVPKDYKILVPFYTIVEWPLIKDAISNPTMFDRIVKAKNIGKFETWKEKCADKYSPAINDLVFQGDLKPISYNSSFFYEYLGPRNNNNSKVLFDYQKSIVNFLTRVTFKKAKRAYNFLTSKTGKDLSVTNFASFIHASGNYFISQVKGIKDCTKVFHNYYNKFVYDHENKLAIYDLSLSSILESGILTKEKSFDRLRLKSDLIDLINNVSRTSSGN